MILIPQKKDMLSRGQKCQRKTEQRWFFIVVWKLLLKLYKFEVNLICNTMLLTKKPAPNYSNQCQLQAQIFTYHEKLVVWLKVSHHLFSALISLLPIA